MPSYSKIYHYEGESQKLELRSLFHWQQRIEPKLKRNKPPTKIDEERLCRHVEAYPDAYLCERAELFGVSESPYAKPSNAWASHVKKTLEHPKADPRIIVYHKSASG